MGCFKGNIYSFCLKRNTNISVIFPDHSNDVDPLYEDEPKVLYLLHGLGGNQEEWLRFSKIEYYAKKYNFVVIMPNGDRSFYTNTLQNIGYFDYIADELPEICHKWFNISVKREDTFIAGESMGGYGAIKIGLSRPENFAGIASLSGVLDFDSFALMVHQGKMPEMDPAELDILETSSSPMDLAIRLAKNETRPKLLQLCGKQDFLIEDNRRFCKKLKKAGYGHTYREQDGDHEWPYWDKAIQYAFMFFRELDLEKTRLY
ncbi:MAG: esterase family protein [Erysipelotrichaceae bacterium]|nr:esterase family protein [Erysipelotrichaceae bacterium]